MFSHFMNEASDSLNPHVPHPWRFPSALCTYESKHFRDLMSGTVHAAFVLLQSAHCSYLCILGTHYLCFMGKGDWRYSAWEGLCDFTLNIQTFSDCQLKYTWILVDFGNENRVKNYSLLLIRMMKWLEDCPWLPQILPSLFTKLWKPLFNIKNLFGKYYLF